MSEGCNAGLLAVQALIGCTKCPFVVTKTVLIYGPDGAVGIMCILALLLR